MKAKTLSDLIKSHLPREFFHFTKRDIAWLWHYLFLDNNRVGNFPFIVTPEILDDINQELLESNSEDAQNILSHHKNMVIDEKYLVWIIEGELRRDLWIYSWMRSSNKTDRLNYRIHTQEFTRNITLSSIKDRIVLAIDIFDATMSNKIAIIDEIKNTYTAMETPLNKINWIDKNNKTILEWSLQYLKAQNKNISFSPPTENELHAYIISSIDLIAGTADIGATAYGKLAIRELFLNKMRNSWNQYKHRQSLTNKKNISLTLSLSAIEKLDQLCERHNITRSALIESILDNFPR